VLDDGIEHHAKNQHEDHSTQRQHEPVQAVQLFSNAGCRRLEVEPVDLWAARQIVDGVGSRGQPYGAAGDQRTDGRLGRRPSLMYRVTCFFHRAHFFASNISIDLYQHQLHQTFKPFSNPDYP